MDDPRASGHSPVRSWNTDVDVADAPARVTGPGNGRMAVIVVSAATAVAGAVYLYLQFRHHRWFGTQNFDLGIFDQGVWLLSDFREPFVTLRGLNIFGDHSSYILVLVAPVFWIWDNVGALGVLTVAALVGAAPLLYAAARTLGVQTWLAAAVAVAYLFHPALAWNVWDNFHPEVLAVPLLVGAYLLAIRSRAWMAVSLLGLALLVKEDTALVVVPFGIWMWWRGWKRQGAVVVGLGIAVLALNVFVLLPYFSPTGELIYTSRYGQFGEGLLDSVWGMLTSPVAVLGELFQTRNLLYYAGMLLPLGAALAAPRLLLLGLPITAANLLSLHAYQADIRFHYTAYLLAVIGIAAVAGARNLQDRLAPAFSQRLQLGIVVLAGAGLFIFGPNPIVQGYNPWDGSTSDPEGVEAAIEVIPEDAVVSADWFLTPHLAHRPEIYMFPLPFREDVWSVPGAPLPSADGVDWVIVQTWTVTSDLAADVDGLTESGEFEVFFENRNAIVFRRISS